jgi:hypothetical protein
VHTNTGNPPWNLWLEDASLQHLDAETFYFYISYMDTYTTISKISRNRCCEINKTLNPIIIIHPPQSLGWVSIHSWLLLNLYKIMTTTCINKLCYINKFAKILVYLDIIQQTKKTLMLNIHYQLSIINVHTNLYIYKFTEITTPQ